MLSVTTRSAERNGMPGLAPGPRSPNATMETGHCDATSPSVSRSRESTWPAWSSWRTAADCRDPRIQQQQRGPGRLPVRDLSAQRGGVRGGSPREDQPDGNPPGPRAEARDGRRRVSGEAPAPHHLLYRRGHHHNGRAERISHTRPEHQQVSSGNAACLERLAHRLIARDQASPADLGGHPVRGAVADRHLGAGVGPGLRRARMPVQEQSGSRRDEDQRGDRAAGDDGAAAAPLPRTGWWRRGCRCRSGALTSAVLAWAGAAVSLAVPASGGGAVPSSRGAAPSPGRPARSPGGR